MKKRPPQKTGNFGSVSLKEYPRKIARKVKAKIKNTSKPNVQYRSFRDFGGFLENSLISPWIYAPFREQDKRCFATMENITRHLTSLSLNSEDKELVSVIMPVYNRLGTIEHAVKSVLEQSYPNFELIVVDDGSDDGTGEYLEDLDDERIRVLHNEACSGVSVARNMGLKEAKGKYIAYLDSDNRWDPRYLAAMMGAFIELPDADVVYSGQILFKGKSKNPFAIRFGSFNRSLLTNRNYIDINALCHTRKLTEQINGFDETLYRLVDYDIIMRMAENSQMYSVPVILSHYYYDITKNAITNFPGYVEYLELVREKREERIDNRELNPEDILFNHKVSVIIPSYEAVEDIKECIESLVALDASEWIEIIVVDNASNKNVINYLEGLHLDGIIKLIKNNVNYGFTYAVNQGIELAEPENDIVILNNDAIVKSGAINNMQKTAYGLPDCGIVVPQQILPANTKTINEHVPFAYSQYECDVNLSKAHGNIINVPVFHSGRFVELSFAPFFCVYVKRDVLNASTGLDPEFGRHYRSDRIFCNYIRHIMKLKVYYTTDAIVYHKLQKSTDELRSNPKKDSNFDIMFYKNQWDPELAAKLGYKIPVWDF